MLDEMMDDSMLGKIHITVIVGMISSTPAPKDGMKSDCC